MSKRNIIEVIDQVLALIPKEWRYDDIHRQLKSISYSAQYTPPECMGDKWYEASHIIANGLKGSDDMELILKVQEVWTGQVSL